MEGIPAEKISSQRQDATKSAELSEILAEFDTPRKTGPLNAQSSVEKETLATESQPVRERLPSPWQEKVN